MERQSLPAPLQDAINSAATLQGDSSSELNVYCCAKLNDEWLGLALGEVTHPFVSFCADGRRVLGLEGAGPE